MVVVAMRVPKDPVPAELRDSAGRQMPGELYVCGTDDTRETVLSVLVSRRFIPVRTADEPVIMFNRDHLIWVRLNLLTAIDEIDAETEDAEESRAARIRVTLDDGTHFDGLVRYLRPSQSQRLSDYLQSVEDFFPVRTSDHVYLVNRAHVVAVTPVVEVVS